MNMILSTSRTGSGKSLLPGIIVVALLLAGAKSVFATESFISVEGQVPQAASAMARQIDRQIAYRLLQPETPTTGVSLAVTVPVDVNNLEESNPLARQMAEELARWFVQAGYSVQEIRKGHAVLYEQGTGEMLLTRRTNLLEKHSIKSAAILTGTYTVTNRVVRFNIRVLQTASQEVLGMATISVPLSSELKPLLGMAMHSVGMGIEPSVMTTLP